MSKWQKFTIPTYYAMSCYTINNTIIMENEKEIQREKENLASHTQRNKQIRINKIDISTKKKKNNLYYIQFLNLLQCSNFT